MEVDTRIEIGPYTSTYAHVWTWMYKYIYIYMCGNMLRMRQVRVSIVSSSSFLLTPSPPAASEHNCELQISVCTAGPHRTAGPRTP